MWWFSVGAPHSHKLLYMEEPSGQQEKVSVPKSTWTGVASGAQADALAREVVDANNNSMKQFDQVE